MIAVLVPVLGRADALRPLVASVAESTTVPWRLVFLCSPGDEQATLTARSIAMDEHRVAVRTVPWEAGHADFQRKTNLGVRETSDPWLFLGATDLAFQPGWDTAALRVAGETGARVIGTDDRGNGLVMAGKHATHSLVARSYIDQLGTIDEPGKVYSEAYSHSFCDNELVETAQVRGEWAFAYDSVVVHLHPFWHKGEMDATYEKALASARPDQVIFRRRRPLWRRGARRAA